MASITKTECYMNRQKCHWLNNQFSLKVAKCLIIGYRFFPLFDHYFMLFSA